MRLCINHDYLDGASFSSNLLRRLLAHWCLKAVGVMFFTGIFFVIYFYLLKNLFFSTTQMPLTYLDRLIGFQPYFLYFYFSLWVYVSLVPSLLKTKRELFYYGGYVGAMCFMGILIYVIFPTTIPDIAVDWARYPEFIFLKSVDASGNAFPSMHVASAFFSFFWLMQLLKQMNASKLFLCINGVWCLGIIYSTMAIKQHVFLDALGGVLLGGFFAYVTIRDYRKRF